MESHGGATQGCSLERKGIDMKRSGKAKKCFDLQRNC
nr:MAG TPA: hypothetical protein [Caudoviricetes sp.]